MKFFNLLHAELLSWIESIFSSIPGLTGVFVRRNWYNLRFAKSKNIYIGVGCKFSSPSQIIFTGTASIGERAYFNANGGKIIIADNVKFNIGVNLNASVGGIIDIGANSLIGPGVMMRTANHIFSDTDCLIRNQGHDSKDIIIEDNCWLGANVLVMGGIRIGKGSVIGAGSIVTKNIPPMSVAVGVPAKIIKSRN